MAFSLVGNHLLPQHDQYLCSKIKIVVVESTDETCKGLLPLHVSLQQLHLLIVTSAHP